MAGASTAGIDLPADLQQELDDLASREGRISHYVLLGVEGDADPGTIRRAYLEKSRRYHPDAWYGKALGRYAPILTRAFQRLSTAYQVLSEESARATYDREHGDLFTADEHARVNRRLAAEADEQRRASERRERCLRMKGFARLGAARQLYEQSLEQVASGHRVQAIFSLTCARELDPGRKEIAQRLADLEKEQAKARATSALALARDQEESGEKSKALLLYASAFQLDPKAHEAAIGAARCADANRDFAQTVSFALRAAELAPNNVDAHLFAAKGFAGLKQKPRAKAELELVLKRDPTHAAAKALLKSL